MEFEELASLIFREIKAKLNHHDGLSIFARERAKFEGWLKVELCDSLSKTFRDVVPEADWIDVTFEDWAIELKTVNTNYRYPGVAEKTRPITKNTEGVIEDVAKLKAKEFPKQGVLFVAFPTEHSKREWQRQLERISAVLRELRHEDFMFKGGIPGVIYFGLV